MTIVYIVAASVIAYGMLIGFRQIQSLKLRVDQLESEKRETEELLLTFMESMNDVVKNEVPVRVEARQDESPKAKIETEPAQEESGQPNIEDVLLRHSIRDTARLLGKGEGEVALYAKLKQK